MSLLDSIQAAKVAICDLLALETLIADSPEFAKVEQDIRNILTTFEQQQAVVVRPTAAMNGGARAVKAASVLSLVELIGRYAVTYGPAFLAAVRQILAILDGAKTQAEPHDKPAEDAKKKTADKPAA